MTLAAAVETRLVTVLPARTLGWAGSVPTGTITNHDLEQHLDTSDAWIVERTGIRQRHSAGPGDTTASMAVEAGRRALDRADVPAAAVDLVILATTTGDRICPATAGTVQHELGTRGAAYDLNAACAGFVHALHIGASALRTPGIEHVLVIGAERLTSITDPDDRGTAILFGDGAGAVLLGAAAGLEPGGDQHDPGIVAVDLGGDGSAVASLGVPTGERFLRMDGQEVFRRATRAMTDSCRATLERAGATADDVDVFVPHQANRRIIDAVAGRLGIPDERVVVNIDRYGNTSAASVPLALAEAADDGRIRAGSLVLACGVGAGMSWATTLLRWGP